MKAAFQLYIGLSSDFLSKVFKIAIFMVHYPLLFACIFAEFRNHGRIGG